MATAAALGLPRLSGEPAESAEAAPGVTSKLRVAIIGVGGRGYFAWSQLGRSEDIVAICDPDRLQIGAAIVRAQDEGIDQLTAAPRFADYREMFATMADQIDAVVVCAPDHHHFPATVLAMQHGKHVYVEKPLTHTVGEARWLRDYARQVDVVTQMGNQGHATEGIRLIKEWFDAGLLGDVERVVSWGPPMAGHWFYRPAHTPPAPGTPPPEVDWDAWLGPAPDTAYTPMYLPRKWRGWWNYGSAMLGDWAAHTLDGPYWALKLGAPEWIEGVAEGHDEWIIPKRGKVTYGFAARGTMPPVTLEWIEDFENLPEPPPGWPADRELPNRGMMMIGSKATLMTSGRPNSPRLWPPAAMEALRSNRVPKTIRRVQGGPIQEWTDAIRGVGPSPGSRFEYSAGLTQLALLGVVAMRAGGRIEWDDVAGRITNRPELNRHIEIQAREGWRFHV